MKRAITIHEEATRAATTWATERAMARAKARRATTVRAGLALLTLGALACTEAGLDPLPTPPSVRDDKARVDGTLCTATPESRVFPLRVLFVVDASESMRVTDAPDPVSGVTGRERAVGDTWETLLEGSPEGVRVGMLRFSAEAYSLTPVDRDGDDLPDSYFTADRDQLASATSRLAVTDRTTNYVNALSEALFQLRTEMQGASLESLPLSKYVVVFISDGLPDPDSGSVEDGSEENILESVEALNELADRFHVGTFEFHTAFLSGGSGPAEDVEAQRMLQRMAELGGGSFRSFPSGESLNFLHVDFNAIRRVFTLQSLSVVNEQAVVDPAQLEGLAGTPGPLDFVDVNGDEAPGCGELLVDSDGDGLIDALEQELGTDPLVDDTDDDGLRDRIEWQLDGLDPLDPEDARCVVSNRCLDEDGDGSCACVVDLDVDGVCDCVDDPDRPCHDALGHDCVDADADGFCDCPDLDGDGRCDYEDRDGDRLNDCEEIFYGTSQNGADTDADGLPDRLEVKALSNPGEADDLADTDLDGFTNGAEARSGSDLACDDSAVRSRTAYRYQVETRSLEDGRTCYDFEVTNVTLVPTLENAAEAAPGNGWNRILVYAGEVAFDDPQSFASYRVACVMAGYRLDGDERNPASGRITLTDADFVDVREFDEDVDCIWP
ncbi:MAG TPA: VWA domain-containing protein [Polyangiaceae bacterium LLY-WYZ-15_(1-7)]|nr:VWA domain-containing protein [Polyangiaceae bacterium LLY-WYZ-15_(1-7)]HJL02281.1 VWA domain-containing protein [Polyangiaceae bacterium LLY-WYZ-15_(1-7)]HJL09311.1 VWA domain-containing protein [Polyangiaceae bacterium LLY-WYZ-15_(1-7)]HJL22918.1 VWA domain-containing protein [Polyangiaceae bacterium LLY-WYZ-15_(1-7)]HJL48564.1 VWA domain-containing protein [Polyangiaceae bacterium LLY-WYZ-15_(1-7)]